MLVAPGCHCAGHRCTPACVAPRLQPEAHVGRCSLRPASATLNFFLELSKLLFHLKINSLRILTMSSGNCLSLLCDRVRVCKRTKNPIPSRNLLIWLWERSWNENYQWIDILYHNTSELTSTSSMTRSFSSAFISPRLLWDMLSCRKLPNLNISFGKTDSLLWLTFNFCKPWRDPISSGRDTKALSWSWRYQCYSSNGSTLRC